MSPWETNDLLTWLQGSGWLDVMADKVADAMVRKLRDAGAIPPARAPARTIELPADQPADAAVVVP